MVMPCAALLFWGGTVQFHFFPGEGHHHLAVGYDADAFIFSCWSCSASHEELKDSLNQKAAKEGECVIAPWYLGHASEKGKIYSFL